MSIELDHHTFARVRPLLRASHFDPTPYAVISGHKRGRIFVDNRDQPSMALVDTFTEWAYLVGQGSLQDYEQMSNLIDNDILPALADAGGDFLSIFTTHQESRQQLRTLLAHRHPHSPAVNRFRFDEARVQSFAVDRVPLADEYELQPMTPALLAAPDNTHLVDDLAFYWDSIEQFWQRGLGFCVLHKGRAVACCHSDVNDGIGQRINIWTAVAHRRRGLATRVGAAFITACLAHGAEPVYLCDAGNDPSRRLAERLGFVYCGDLQTVDVPVRPFAFYVMLGQHFAHSLGRLEQAVTFFEKASALKPGDSGVLYQTAVTLAMMGNERQARQRLQDAVKAGWNAWDDYLEEPAFAPFRGRPAWRTLTGEDGQNDSTAK